MAKTRIRYINEGSTLVSKGVFPITLDNELLDIRVILNRANMKFSIVDASNLDKVLLGGGDTKNLAVLKIQAKNGLRELGYEFGNETRNKNTTLSSGSTTVEAISALSTNG